MPTLHHNIYRIYWKCKDAIIAFERIIVAREKNWRETQLNL